MKTLPKIALMFCLSAAIASAQENKAAGVSRVNVIFNDDQTKSEAISDGFDPELVAQKIEDSRKDLEASIGSEDASMMSPIGVKYMLLDERPNSSETNQDLKDLNNELDEAYRTGAKGILFITWGYNRGFHSKSDLTIKTDLGSYTIKDGVGKDRPSSLNIKYLHPANFTIPQYNLKIGYWFSKESKFGVAVGTDHMKWVFDPSKKYDIEGDYIGDLWVGGEKKTFEEVKAGRDASFLYLEHSDGYNYPYVEGLYRNKLMSTNRFEIDAVGGLGAGILFPKTRTRIADQESTANFRDIDNKFHVAGYAFHTDASLVLKYKLKNGISYFAKPTIRGVVGKINNALYYGKEGSISQSPIYTLEPSLNVGMEIPLNAVVRSKTKSGATRELRRLEKVKAADKRNPNDELSLDELQRRYEEVRR